MSEDFDMRTLEDVPPAPVKKRGRKPKNAQLWVRHPDDWYVEPPWCDQALFRAVKFTGTIVDPCCGMGRVLDAAHAAGYTTFGMDIVDRGASKRHHFAIANFLERDEPIANIAFNPPYKHADACVVRGVERAQRICAVLLQARYANAQSRVAMLRDLPLRQVLQLSPRPSMPPGTVIEAGEPAGGGEQDFAWYVFEKGYTGKPEFGWACRREPVVATGGGLDPGGQLVLPGCERRL